MKKLFSVFLCVVMIATALSPFFALSISADEVKDVPILDYAKVKTFFEKSKYSVTDTFKSSTGTSLPYRMYVPEDYDPEKSYPLVLSFHGAGERGTNNQHIFTGGSVFQRLLHPDERKEHPCIILAPQCNPSSQWVLSPWGPGTYDHTKIQKSPYMAAAEELLEEVLKEYSVDQTRLYVTGISMGGFGTWDIISRNPDKFAAAIPICGGTDASYLENLKGFPIRTFHAADDPIVACTGTRKANEILNGTGDFKYTEYTSGGHLIWDRVYKTGDLMDWLFAQTLSNISTSFVTDENVTLTGKDSVESGSSLTVSYEVKEGYVLKSLTYRGKELAFTDPTSGSVTIDSYIGGEIIATTEEQAVVVPSIPEENSSTKEESAPSLETTPSSPPASDESSNEETSSPAKPSVSAPESDDDNSPSSENIASGSIFGIGVIGIIAVVAIVAVAVVVVFVVLIIKKKK